MSQVAIQSGWVGQRRVKVGWPAMVARMAMLDEEQRAVLDLVANGATCEQTAASLGIRPRTVRLRLTKAYRALGIPDTVNRLPVATCVYGQWREREGLR